MCEALAKNGVRTVLFATSLADRGTLSPLKRANVLDVPTDRSVISNGVEVRYFGAWWPSRFSFSPGMAVAIQRRIREFDLIHIHSLYLFSTLAAAYIARRSGVPYVIRPHGTLDPYMRRRHRVRKFLYTKLLEHRNLDGAAAIHYTAQEEMELAAPLGLKAARMLVPLGVSSEEFSHIPPRGTFRSRHPHLANRRLVVFIGRLVPKKGLDLLIESFGELLRNEKNVQLVIAGSDEDGYEAVIRRLVRSKGLEQHTLFLGMTTGEDKLALLADADVWALPSYSENFGLAVVEAMACGVAVVISNRVNIHRDVATARAGAVIDCDAQQLTDTLRRLLNNPAERRSMGQCGRALVASRFTWESSADKLVQAYRAILSGRSAAQVDASSQEGRQAENLHGKFLNGA
jgi:glycosyltransferase involved in cell wall biosynthesis